MITTLVLPIVLALIPRFGIAAEKFGNIIPFGARPGPAHAAADDAMIRSMQNLFAVLGVPDLPPYALRFVRQLQTRRDLDQARDDLRRFDLAFRYYAAPAGDIAPGLAHEDAFERARRMIHRRPRVADVMFEVDEFRRSFVFRYELGHDAVDCRDEAFQAAELRQGANVQLIARPADALSVRMNIARRRLNDIARGFEPAPAVIGEYALTLASSHDHADDVERACDAYEASLAFALRPLGENGLGFDFKRAHGRFVGLSSHKFDGFIVDRIASVYRDVYRRLIAPTAAGGFGLLPRAAQGEALATAERVAIPGAGLLGEMLKRRQTWPDFFTAPIRAGGLGLAPGSVSATTLRWQRRFSPAVSSDEVIRMYQAAVARYLAKASAVSRDNEVEARDRALEQIGDGLVMTMNRLSARLDAEEIPRVALDELLAKDLAGERISNCVQSLFRPE